MATFGIRQAATAARLLRGALDRVGFSAPAVRELLGPADPRLSPVEQEALWSYRARTPEPLAMFARLFLLGEAVGRSDARSVWGDDLPAARTAGVMGGQGARHQALLALSLHDGLPIFADRFADRPARAPGREIVVGPTRASLVLERALPRAAVASALDLGTGAGLLALRLANGARRVVASDVSARALAFTALNAAVNQVRNLTLMRSDRFAALARRRFDVVAGNLPFVVAPGRQYTYRDGGMALDGFTSSVIGGAGKHLVEGGFALFLGQWVHQQDQAEDLRLAPWFVAAGCDAVVFRMDLETVDGYAARWSAGPRLNVPLATRVSDIGRWVAQLRRHRVDAISTGLFVLRRRRTDRHFMAIDTIEPSAASPDWESIAARFAAIDS